MMTSQLAAEKVLDRVRSNPAYKAARRDAMHLSDQAKWDEANEALDDLDDLFCNLTFDAIASGGDAQVSEFTSAIYERLDRELFAA